MRLFCDPECVCAKSLRSCPTVCNLWTIACQAPLSMGFSRQEYWGGLPCPSPGNLPNPRIKTGSPALQVDSLPSEPPGRPMCSQVSYDSVTGSISLPFGCSLTKLILFCFDFIIYLFLTGGIIALQYCAGFWHTSIQISHSYIYMSPPCWTSLPLPTPFHPSRLSRSTGFELPVSHSKFPLADYFTYVM